MSEGRGNRIAGFSEEAPSHYSSSEKKGGRVASLSEAESPLVSGGI